MSIKPIYRSSKNKIFGGVAGGLAERFKINSKVVRIAFVIVFVFPGTTLFAAIGYIALWIIMPIKKSEDNSKNNTSDFFKQFFGKKEAGRVVDAPHVEKKSE